MARCLLDSRPIRSSREGYYASVWSIVTLSKLRLIDTQVLKTNKIRPIWSSQIWIFVLYRVSLNAVRIHIHIFIEYCVLKQNSV